MSDDLISRQDLLESIERISVKGNVIDDDWVYRFIQEFPSAQSEQTKMIEEIRKWINSGNRGRADYFIVDKIEEIINKYE